MNIFNSSWNQLTNTYKSKMISEIFIWREVLYCRPVRKSEADRRH